MMKSIFNAIGLLLITVAKIIWWIIVAIFKVMKTIFAFTLTIIVAVCVGLLLAIRRK